MLTDAIVAMKCTWLNVSIKGIVIRHNLQLEHIRHLFYRSGSNYVKFTTFSFVWKEEIQFHSAIIPCLVDSVFLSITSPWMHTFRHLFYRYSIFSDRFNWIEGKFRVKSFRGTHVRGLNNQGHLPAPFLLLPAETQGLLAASLWGSFWSVTSSCQIREWGGL